MVNEKIKQQLKLCDSVESGLGEALNESVEVIGRKSLVESLVIYHLSFLIFYLKAKRRFGGNSIMRNGK